MRHLELYVFGVLVTVVSLASALQYLHRNTPVEPHKAIAASVSTPALEVAEEQGNPSKNREEERVNKETPQPTTSSEKRTTQRASSLPDDWITQQLAQIRPKYPPQARQAQRQHTDETIQERHATQPTKPVRTVNEKELLWFARGIYSETNRPHEMRYVAWVIRNRVDTRFRGKTTYRGVILDPYQFTAFNGWPRVPRRVQRNLDDGGETWRHAIRIAREVATAPESARPIPVTTRHFYSPQSMRPAYSKPRWVRNTHRSGCEHLPIRDVLDHRFRFYRNCDTNA